MIPPPEGGGTSGGTVSIADFKKIELRTAKILAAEEVPGADRLWKLTLDTGGETRTIVAGIKAAYPREALPGKTIILVYNLEPAVIRGVESRGMLLAAKSPEKLTLVTVESDVPPGSVVG